MLRSVVPLFIALLVVPSSMADSSVAASGTSCFWALNLGTGCGSVHDAITAPGPSPCSATCDGVVHVEASGSQQVGTTAQLSTAWRVNSQFQPSNNFVPGCTVSGANELSCDDAHEFPALIGPQECGVLEERTTLVEGIATATVGQRETSETTSFVACRTSDQAMIVPTASLPPVASFTIPSTACGSPTRPPCGGASFVNVSITACGALACALVFYAHTFVPASTTFGSAASSVWLMGSPSNANEIMCANRYECWGAATFAASTRTDRCTTFVVATDTEFADSARHGARVVACGTGTGLDVSVSL